VSYITEIQADSPLAWWRCKEASGNLQDSSGNARHCDETHGSPTYAVTGPITSEGSDTALTLHSAGPDWYNVPYNAAFDVGDTCSAECWIKRADSSTSEMDLVTRDQGILLALTNNQVAIGRAGVAFICKSTNTITDTSTWHHLVVTKTGATVKVYVDAVDVSGTVTNSTYTNGTTPTIKLGADGGTDPFNGSIDEIAIYSTALSSARVSAHYTAATAGAGGGGGTGAGKQMLLGVG
jgi:Concanavalin A-like lectin/glucanases superfamily